MQQNIIELSAILYYADFLSLSDISIPVTDLCTYFYIYDAPINAAFIADRSPIYDENNLYILQSKIEYDILKNKFGDDGVLSFINKISHLSVTGKVTGMDMLKCIHLFSLKRERLNAYNKYKLYMKNITYSHLIKTEDGKSKRSWCTKYIAHDEIAKKLRTEPKIHTSLAKNIANLIEHD